MRGCCHVERTADEEPVTLLRQHFVARHLSRLRHLVVWAAHRVGLDHHRGEDLALAVSEAASNAVQHGGATGELELIQDDNRALIAQISDTGPGMSASTPAPADPNQEHGRGLYLIQQLCDRVHYRTGPTGTTVHLEMHLDNR
jgi:serine/threonine-protein kinase RsbW